MRRTFQVDRVGEPSYFAENCLAAHSDHRWFTDADEAVAGSSSFERCLNGRWKFHYAKNPAACVPGFETVGFDCSSWDDLPVPSHLQLHGHGKPQYTNVQYPWDGYEAVWPGQVPQRDNPVGSYVTTFQLDEPLAPGERLSVSFQGAESAIAVWLNGEWIGYGADSFTPSEFDLTEALIEGENKLAAQVFRFTSGSWIEDQDFFRFSGIFRDVILYRRPAVHAEDVKVTTQLSEDCDQAEVCLEVALVGAGGLRAELVGVGELRAAGDGSWRVRVANPRLWSAEDPHLYRLNIEVRDETGRLAEFIPQQVGIRRFGIEDGLLRINGRRIVFHGVNRHEFGLSGRVMTREQTEADLKLMKANNINAVRTSHYPNNSFFYELCDRYGLYVIDEMNLEAHGIWDALIRGRIGPAEVVPGDRPEWHDVLLNRAENMLQRDKNHPCVVMWSCGNESFGGSNIRSVAEWFKEFDTRPVHYEGVHADPRYPQTSDVTSRMYAPATEVEAWLTEHRERPFILCEYAHAMGNSFGAVDEYLDLAYRDELFQGGFIWDFADQALPMRDRYGVPFFGYGGDSGEAPSDYDFCANGLLFADHTPKPLMQEVKYLYQGLKTSIRADGFEVENRHLFTSTSAFECVARLGREGRTLATSAVETDVAPGERGTYPLPFEVPEGPGEYTVDISFRLRRATAWADAGHEVGYQQAVFANPEPAAGVKAPRRPEIIDGIHNIGVRGERFVALFSRLHGGLVSYQYGHGPSGGRELLRGVPGPSFWHAPTSNELGWDGPHADGQWLLASRYPKRKPPPQPSLSVANGVAVVRYQHLLPTTPASTCEVSYRVDGNGRIEVELALDRGEGVPDLPEFGMMLTVGADLNRLRWYGEGPAECYVDRRRGARLGVYTADVADQLTSYVRPQEAGSHTGVRWAEVTDADGWGLRFDCPAGMEFSALPWTPFEVENAAHPNELPPVHQTVLRPALMRRGVAGDDSWGAMTHRAYLLPAGLLKFEFGFVGIC